MRKIPWFALMLFLALCICCAQADVLTFPSDLTTIAEEAFAGDTSLDEAVLPERLNAIGRHSFAYSSLRRQPHQEARDFGHVRFTRFPEGSPQSESRQQRGS